jgi:hypothetical protein
VPVALGRLHEFPQNPQLFGSEPRLVSQPLLVSLSQSIKPGAQDFSPQAPALHTAAAPNSAVHTLGQLPQWNGSLATKTSQPFFGSESQFW